jgi:imidazolonepropionase-like amidohydrolase
MRNAALLAAVLASVCLAPQSPAETIVVTGARMVDVLAGREVEQPQIVVTDGRISAVGRQGDPAPADARKIDLGNRTILPGLIDMHVHLTSDPLISGYRRLEYTDSFWMTVGVANARRTLEAGFTTVRNVGSGEYQDVGLDRRALRCHAVSAIGHDSRHTDRELTG